MALVAVGYTIPDEGIVGFTCERPARRVIYTRIRLAYAMGGMRAVRSFLVHSTDEDGVTRAREI